MADIKYFRPVEAYSHLTIRPLSHFMLENNLFIKIKDLLDESKIDYQVLKHAPVYTSSDAAKIRGTDLSEGAKALVFMADKKPVMVVVPGDKKVDTKKFKKLFNFKDLRMATTDEVKEVSGVEVGAVAPFGGLMEIETFVDRDFENDVHPDTGVSGFPSFSPTSKNKKMICFNAGKHQVSIRMKAEDYLRVVKPRIGDFSVKMKD